jgi:Flp pilus assembly protein TadB
MNSLSPTSGKAHEVRQAGLARLSLDAILLIAGLLALAAVMVAAAIVAPIAVAAFAFAGAAGLVRGPRRWRAVEAH